MNDQKYLVIIGDIVKSREIKNREQLQTVFRKHLHLSKTLGLDKNIISGFTVTIGDEFQGVISSANHLFKFILNFEEMLRDGIKENIDFRYGFGVGKITTKINKEAAIGMDGPAFYNARESLMSIKKENLKYGFKSNTNMDIVINNLLHWLDDKIKNWAAPKIRIINMYREEQTQKRIAEKLKITQPAISKMLKSSNMDLIIKTENIIENEINKILARPNNYQYSMVAEPK